MWHLSGFGALDREMSWGISKDNLDDTECLRLSLGLYRTRTITKVNDTHLLGQSFNSLQSILASTDAWLVVGQKKWEIDLDQLHERYKQLIPSLTSWQWFRGRIVLVPEISVEESTVFGETRFEVSAFVVIDASSITMMEKFTKLVQPDGLAQVLNSRWEESKRTLAAEAYLSTIILLGSILEGILLAKVQKEPEKANKAKSAPKDTSRNTKLFADWTLNDLIVVCHECNWIGKDARDFSDTLREYRNLVHPGKQVKADIYPDGSTCRISREVIEAVLDDLKVQ